MIVVLMGVTGSGKTTVGQVLAQSLGWSFLDGDDFHPAANIAKMHAGIPLTDADRQPWLDALRRRIDQECDAGHNVVFACSALKHAYQDYLDQDEPDCVKYVHLTGSEELIRTRLAGRKNHFMNPNLLRSQIETLEAPDDALHVDITPPPAAIAATIRQRMGL